MKLHHHLLILLYCIILVQSATTQTVLVGLEAGPTYTDLRLSNEFSRKIFDPMAGFTAGTNFTIRFTKNLGLRTGLNFERKGTQTNLSFTDDNGTISFNVNEKQFFDFISLPILLEASFGNRIKGIVQLGQSIGFLAQHTSHFKNLPSLNGPDKFHRTDDFRRVEHAIVGGVGLELKLAEVMSAQFLVRPSYGLTNLDNDSFAFGSNEIRTVSVAGMLGFQVRLN